VSAIYVDAGTVLNNTTVRGNAQHTAIYVSSGSLTLNNSTVSGNSSTAGPGGIYDVWGNVTLNNSTVTNNRSQDDTAGIRKATGYGGTVILRNSIVAGNISATVAVNQGPDCRGVMTSHGYNLIGNKLGCTFSAKPGDKVGTNASPIDPRLGSLRNNGGSTWTHALAGNSPALNAGNPAVPGSGGDACLATDQRGVDRVAEHDCDMGAFEGHFVVVLSVIRTSPNPTSASTVTYKVTFSDPVTGVDKSAPFNDFGFTLTGVTGASVSSVSGSGKIYTVTVNTGTGGGTLQLNIVDNDTIKDAAGKPLGQSGKGNGNFAGQVYTVNR
jgi:hypothetical protein